jgi:hypothetical protein
MIYDAIYSIWYLKKFQNIPWCYIYHGCYISSMLYIALIAPHYAKFCHLLHSLLQEAAEKVLSRVEEVVKWLHKPLDDKTKQLTCSTTHPFWQEEIRYCGIQLAILGPFGAENQVERHITSHWCCQICGPFFVWQDAEARSRWSYAVCNILLLTNFQAKMGTECWHQGLRHAFIASFTACQLKRRREDIYNPKKYNGLRKLQHDVTWMQPWQ